MEVKKKVLIIDDESSLLQALCTKVMQAGYNVDKAMDGMEGLELALRLHPDLIILDMLMPKMDGMFMLNKLRQDPWGKSVHVIILSNLDTNNDLLLKVTVNQPSFYLLKSDISLDQVVDKVKELIG